MLDDIEIGAVETAFIETDGEAGTAEAPVLAAGTPCACGSGLVAEACCSLDLKGLRPAEPTPQNHARLEALLDARRQADQDAATDLSIAILTEQPTLLEALSMLFLVRKDQDNHPAALALIRRAAILAPQEPRYAKYLIDELIVDRAWGQAEAAARRAVRLKPADALAHAMLGQVFTAMHRDAEGEHHLRLALALGEARGPAALVQLAGNLRAQGQFDEARALYAEARALAPGFVAALLGLAETEQQAGDFVQAEARLAEAEAAVRPSPALTRLKAQVAFNAARPEETLALLQTGFPSAEAHAAQDLYLQGQALDKLGRFDEAFAAFEAANATHLNMAGGPFDLDRSRQVARTARAFTRDEGPNGLPPMATATGPQPLFVVGCPRSGTTLLEQSLSMHPDIVAGGELNSLTATAQASARLLGSPSPYPASLAELWMGDQRDQASLLRDHYLNSARRALSPGEARWFTDKALTHELYLGFAHLLFPASPIVHIVRHPLDVVVSNYANGLPHGGFAGGVAEVAEYYMLLLETAEHSIAANPDIRYLRVRYENLLEDQAHWTRRILDFAGLPFDAACLRSHENTRYARTVSQHQVREKINSRSKARYRNYLAQLGPAIEVLEPAIARLGYDV
jgi:tetratricopeptide (TPR) repeat protein